MIDILNNSFGAKLRQNNDNSFSFNKSDLDNKHACKTVDNYQVKSEIKGEIKQERCIK